MMRIATFNATCEKCKHRFTVPLLSDMSYGEFLYIDKNGLDHKYYCGLDESHWEMIEPIVDKFDTKHRFDKGDEIRRIIGLIADRPSETDYYLTGKWICPACNSDSVAVEGTNRIDFVDVEDLLFERFDVLSLVEQECEIENLIKSAWR